MELAKRTLKKKTAMDNLRTYIISEKLMAEKPKKILFCLTVCFIFIYFLRQVQLGFVIIPCTLHTLGFGQNMSSVIT